MTSLIFEDFAGVSENQQKTETSQNNKLDNFCWIYFCRLENKWNFAGKKSSRFCERQSEYCFLLLKMTKKTVFCHWGDLRVMRARQFCTENDPFANTVFLKKKTLILKSKACPQFFFFSLKYNPSKTMKNAFHFFLKALFVLKIF